MRQYDDSVHTRQRFQHGSVVWYARGSNHSKLTSIHGKPIKDGLIVQFDPMVLVSNGMRHIIRIEPEDEKNLRIRMSLPPKAVAKYIAYYQSGKWSDPVGTIDVALGDI